MNSGRFILSQVLDLIHRQTLDRIVKRYEPRSSVRHFGFRQQLTYMVFAQMTSRDGLRDITTPNDGPRVRGLIEGFQPFGHPDLGPVAGMWRAVKNPFNHDLAPCSLADSLGRWQGLVFVGWRWVENTSRDGTYGPSK